MFFMTNIIMYKGYKIDPNGLSILDNKDGRVSIKKMAITYEQPDDSAHYADEDYAQQILTIETGSVELPDEGTCPFYFVLKTERWAVEDEAELSAILKDFVMRLSLDTTSVINPEYKDEEENEQK